MMITREQGAVLFVYCVFFLLGQLYKSRKRKGRIAKEM